jgi:hypothetical protein
LANYQTIWSSSGVITSSATTSQWIVSSIVATIVPSASDRRMVIFFTGNIWCGQINNGYVYLTIFRNNTNGAGTTANGTNIAIANASGGGPPCLATIGGGSSSGGIQINVSGFATDSPATTSSTTYTLCFNNQNGGSSGINAGSGVSSIMIREY